MEGRGDRHISVYEMLDRIHDEGIPYELDPEALDRVGAILHAKGSARAAAEARVPYGSPATSDATSGIAQLREQFRPQTVRWLFVGESSPASGTHFHRANSNLFRATREAFAMAPGEEVVPDGARFLHFFREQGAWLVDLADRPVNRMRGRPRKAAVDAGVARLAGLIRETSLSGVFVVKASIAAAVRQAAGIAGFKGAIVELPFPVRQWKTVYVRELARAIGATDTVAVRQ